MDSDTSARLDAVLRVVGRAGVSVFSADTDLRYRWIENPPTGWPAAALPGTSDGDLLPAAAAAAATAAKREALSTGRPVWADLVVGANGSERYYDLFVTPERNRDGAIDGVAGVVIDVTDRRRQAATLEQVAREISHRSKNLLAIIQSLATQTAKAAPSTDDFIERFRGRIQSISRSQDLPIGARKAGIGISGLIRGQCEPYVMDGAKRIAFEGGDWHLSPNATLHVGLALHELCMGAVRFGALSTEDGTVSITAAPVDGPTGRALRLVWAEDGGASAPDTAGFEKALLERIVPASVGGSARIERVPRGRRYELTISASEFDDP